MNEANHQNQYKMVSKKGVSKKGVLGFLQLVINSSVYYQADINVFDVAFRVAF